MSASAIDDALVHAWRHADGRGESTQATAIGWLDRAYAQQDADRAARKTDAASAGGGRLLKALETRLAHTGAPDHPRALEHIITGLCGISPAAGGGAGDADGQHTFGGGGGGVHAERNTRPRRDDGPPSFEDRPAVRRELATLPGHCDTAYVDTATRRVPNAETWACVLPIELMYGKNTRSEASGNHAGARRTVCRVAVYPPGSNPASSRPARTVLVDGYWGGGFAPLYFQYALRVRPGDPKRGRTAASTPWRMLACLHMQPRPPTPELLTRMLVNELPLVASAHTHGGHLTGAMGGWVTHVLRDADALRQDADSDYDDGEAPDDLRRGSVGLFVRHSVDYCARHTLGVRVCDIDSGLSGIAPGLPLPNDTAADAAEDLKRVRVDVASALLATPDGVKYWMWPVCQLLCTLYAPEYVWRMPVRLMAQVVEALTSDAGPLCITPLRSVWDTLRPLAPCAPGKDDDMGTHGGAFLPSVRIERVVALRRATRTAGPAGGHLVSLTADTMYAADVWTEAERLLLEDRHLHTPAGQMLRATSVPVNVRARALGYLIERECLFADCAHTEAHQEHTDDCPMYTCTVWGVLRRIERTITTLFRRRAVHVMRAHQEEQRALVASCRTGLVRGDASQQQQQQQQQHSSYSYGATVDSPAHRAPNCCSEQARALLRVSYAGGVRTPVHTVEGQGGSGKSTFPAHLTRVPEWREPGAVLVVAYTNQVVANANSRGLGSALSERERDRTNGARGFRAMTAHKAVRVLLGNATMRRAYGINGCVRVLVVDEAACMPLAVWSHLLQLLARHNAHFDTVLVLGDRNQLRPVHWGCVLELCATAYPHTLVPFVHQHRTDNAVDVRIAANNRAIVERRPDDLLFDRTSYVCVDPGNAWNADDVRASVRRAARFTLDDMHRRPEHVQGLSFNKGIVPHGEEGLAIAWRDELVARRSGGGAPAPTAPAGGGDQPAFVAARTLYVGDAVSPRKTSAGFFRGQKLIVESITDRPVGARADVRGISLQSTAQRLVSGHERIVVLCDCATGTHMTAGTNAYPVDDLRLDYFRTVHKYQGNETPVVVGMTACMRSRNGAGATRRFLYTLVSRACRTPECAPLVVLVDTPDHVRTMVRTEDPHVRDNSGPLVARKVYAELQGCGEGTSHDDTAAPASAFLRSLQDETAREHAELERQASDTLERQRELGGGGGGGGGRGPSAAGEVGRNVLVQYADDMGIAPRERVTDLLW